MINMPFYLSLFGGVQSEFSWMGCPDRFCSFIVIIDKASIVAPFSLCPRMMSQVCFGSQVRKLSWINGTVSNQGIKKVRRGMIKMVQLIYDISVVTMFNLTRWLCQVMIHEPLGRHHLSWNNCTASVVLHLVPSSQELNFIWFLSFV
jgi:hypothetical protein